MFMSLVELVSSHRDSTPIVAAFLIAVYVLFQVKDTNHNTKYIRLALEELTRRVERGEENMEDIQNFVYKHYNLTHEEARRYLHYHVGCSSQER